MLRTSLIFVATLAAVSGGADRSVTQPATQSATQAGTASTSRPFADLFDRAKGYETDKDFGKAYAVYLLIRRDDPKNAQACMGEAECLAAMSQTTEAMRRYEDALQLPGPHDLILNNMGLIEAQDGEFNRACNYYEQALVENPNCKPALLNEANAKFQSQSYGAARKLLERVIKIDPKNYVAWLNAGVMAEALGDFKSAELYFNYAARFSPTSVEPWVYLGMAYEKEAKWMAAVHSFYKAMQIDPRNVEAKKFFTFAYKKHLAEAATQPTTRTASSAPTSRPTTEASP